MTITDFFAQSGPLSIAFKDYELRDGQVKLSKNIFNTMDKGGVGLYEAGTGIGKSMAYLLPAYIRAKITSSPVVISTTTNNLLFQLLNNDLPLLQKVLASLGEELKFVGIKGKSHYACLAKMENMHDEDMQKIVKDIELTKNGERSELDYFVPEEKWKKIAYDIESCGGAKCPFYKDCFITTLKKKAEKVNIIVTNHSIIFAEKFAKFKILPDYDDLVFDEGHNIENVATDFLTQTLYFTQMKSLSIDIFQSDGRHKSGLATFPKLKPFAPHLIAISDKIFKFELDLTDNFNSTNSSDEQEFTLPDKNLMYEKFEPLKETIKDLQNILSAYDYNNVNQMSAISAVLNFSIEIFHWIENIPNSSFLLWGRKNRGQFHLNQTPLKIGTLLKSEVYDKLNSVNIVSATLTVNQSFKYIQNRLGLEIQDRKLTPAEMESDFPEFQDKFSDENPLSIQNKKLLDEDDSSENIETKKLNITTKIFKSPFDYSTQMKLIIRDDIPDQKSEEYFSEICKAILEGIKTSYGNAFVLFTSYSLMNDVTDSLWKKIEALDLTLLVQESGNRDSIIDKFKKGNCVLFGVESFWEGVDIAGDALRHVIITKLPFKVPTTPIEKARADMVESNGGNSFYDLSLPQAVIKFRQGIGRLIRTKNDTGYLTILDSRVVNSSYGRIFMDEINKLYE